MKTKTSPASFLHKSFPGQTRSTLIAFTVLMGMALAPQTQADFVVGDLINVDLEHDSNGTAATGDAGPFSQTGTPTWNVVNTTSNLTNVALSDAGGQSTGITLSTTGITGAWRNTAFTTDSADSVVRDYINSAIGGNTTFTFSNVPAGTYELYVIAGVFQWEATAEYTTNVTIGSVTQSVVRPIYTDVSDFIPSGLGWVEGTNFTKFELTLESPGTISGTMFSPTITAGSGDDQRVFMNGFQLVAIPEPSTIVLVGISLGSLLIFRRRR